MPAGAYSGFILRKCNSYRLQNRDRKLSPAKWPWHSGHEPIPVRSVAIRIAGTAGPILVANESEVKFAGQFWATRGGEIVQVIANANGQETGSAPRLQFYTAILQVDCIANWSKIPA